MTHQLRRHELGWCFAATNVTLAAIPGQPESGWIIVAPAGTPDAAWLDAHGLQLMRFRTLKDAQRTFSAAAALGPAPPTRRSEPKLIRVAAGRYRTADGAWRVTRTSSGRWQIRRVRDGWTLNHQLTLHRARCAIADVIAAT